VERGGGFEDFYQAERSTVMRAVGFALGDVDLGAEATDEALARAYERWADVGEMGNPAGWVYRVAVNIGRNRTRRRLLERRRPVPPDRERADIGGWPTRRSPVRSPRCRSISARWSCCGSTSTGRSTRSPPRSAARPGRSRAGCIAGCGGWRRRWRCRHDLTDRSTDRGSPACPLRGPGPHHRDPGARGRHRAGAGAGGSSAGAPGRRPRPPAWAPHGAAPGRGRGPGGPGRRGRHRAGPAGRVGRREHRPDPTPRPDDATSAGDDRGADGADHRDDHDGRAAAGDSDRADRRQRGHPRRLGRHGLGGVAARRRPAVDPRLPGRTARRARSHGHRLVGCGVHPRRRAQSRRGARVGRRATGDRGRPVGRPAAAARRDPRCGGRAVPGGGRGGRFRPGHRRPASSGAARARLMQAGGRRRRCGPAKP
jgi:hypothetical protein